MAKRDVEEANSLIFLLRREPIPFMRAPYSKPNYHPYPAPPHTIELGIRHQHMDLGGGTQISVHSNDLKISATIVFLLVSCCYQELKPCEMKF